MAISTDEYARLSADLYFDRADGTPVPDTNFTIYKALENTASGYYGVIYRNSLTGELVVADRGTEFDDNGSGTDILRNLVEADGQMALDYINQLVAVKRHVVNWKLLRDHEAKI